MINYKLIYKVMGSLLFIEAAMTVACLAMAIFWQEDDTLAFAVTLIVTVTAALGLKFIGHGAENSMGKRDAYLLVTLTWTVFSILGALPFLVSGYITGYTDAFFETMSGFTTTGASVIDDVERLPHGLIFWRTMMQWIGGLGIVFFTIAILPSLVGGSMRVFSAEATGPMRSKMHPRLSTSAKAIWVVYILLTAGCAAGFYLAGLNVFDSLNYSMTITGTGGFATHNDGLAVFRSEAVDYVAIGFMFFSGVNFTLMYMSVVKGKVKALWKDSELRFYLFLVVAATAIITLLLRFGTSGTVDSAAGSVASDAASGTAYDWADALRCALFQVVSFTTTTGIFNTDTSQFSHAVWIILAVCVFVGACSGSTSGGMKSVRGVMLLKIVRNEFKHIIHPRAILPVRIGEAGVPVQTQVRLFVFLALYIAACVVAYVIFVCMGLADSDALIIAISCASNIGLPLGLDSGSQMSWAALPVAGKWICTALMLIGRLEFFSVLVLFTPAFWKKN